VDGHAAANGANGGSNNGQRQLAKLMHPWSIINA